MTLSELNAVNRILMALGDVPVNALTGDITSKARIANNLLDQVLADVQREDWHWNRDSEYSLSADAITGKVPVPTNLISFVVEFEPWITIRDGFLYDRQNQTFELETGKTGIAVFALEWDEIPESAKVYIAARAARLAYSQFGDKDQTTLAILVQEERMARHTLLDEDLRVSRINMLDDPYLPYLKGSEYVPGAPRFPRY